LAGGCILLLAGKLCSMLLCLLRIHAQSKEDLRHRCTILSAKLARALEMLELIGIQGDLAVGTCTAPQGISTFLRFGVGSSQYLASVLSHRASALNVR